MKIKYQIILLLTAMVMLFGGCGKKNTVVTGRYYYPDQEKDAKTEETSDDADESAETTEENEAVIGSDQFLIKTNDMQEECLTLEQIASGKEYVYYYTLATRFLDKYGNRTAVSYFEPGRVITVGEKDDQGKVTQVQISDAVWEYPDVSRYSVDMDRGIFKIGDERYSYDADLYICEDDLRKQLSDLTDLDTLRVTGIGKKLISIVVTTGHGELALTNTDLFEGSFIQIGSKIFAEVTKDMTMELPAGTYTVTVANNGYGGSTELTIESGRTETLDLNTLKGAGPKFGNILFAVDVEDALIQIDGKVVDTEEAVPIQYGVHSLTVTAPGYDTFNKKLFVNSEEATIVVGMSGDGTGTDSTTEETETENNAETANEADSSAEGAAGSLAGSLAGSHTAGESGGTTSGSSTGTVAGTTAGSGTDTSTGTAAGSGTGTGTSSDLYTGNSTGDGTSTGSSADYLSKLSELLSTLSGNSN